MVMRISPATNQAAVLSFPRDLWVKIHGRNGSGRINSAYDPTDPTRLAGRSPTTSASRSTTTSTSNLCMFKTLVDAVGGVNVPFAVPGVRQERRPRHPRSRAASPSTATRRWRGCAPASSGTSTRRPARRKQDASSDFGRISRQQDFLRRLAATAISEGLTKPGAATTFLNTYLGCNVTTDTGLTVGKMLDFVSAMRNIDPSSIRTYQVETVSEPHNGAVDARPGRRAASSTTRCSPCSRARPTWRRSRPAPRTTTPDDLDRRVDATTTVPGECDRHDAAGRRPGGQPAGHRPPRRPDLHLSRARRSVEHGAMRGGTPLGPVDRRQPGPGRRGERFGLGAVAGRGDDQQLVERRRGRDRARRARWRGSR